jgi:N-acetylglucosaminyl-diphospho-decaprenol L-rhamnosyltransferase
MTGRPEIAIVIVSYNTRELLLECIGSVVECVARLPVEIVVVDNNSDDGSSEAVRSRFPLVKTIDNESNLGFGAACNQGICATHAPFVLLLNSDARITKPALRALYACMLERERCGASGCRIVDAQGRESVNTRNFLTPFNQALELTGLTSRMSSRLVCRTHSPVIANDQLDCSVDWIDGACLMLRRAALEAIGLFDREFFMYSEDEDLCYRLRRAGWSVCFTSAGEVVHHGGASAEQSRCEMLRHFYCSQMIFLSKHHGSMWVFLFRVLMTTVLMSKALVHSLRGAEARREDVLERLAAFKSARSARRQ